MPHFPLLFVVLVGELEEALFEKNQCFEDLEKLPLQEEH
jgi:hypothetical protein